MKVPILIAIPFWDGDKAQAYSLCQIIAGLQGVHAGNIVNVMLIARQDCKIDKQLINIISPKFNTFTYICNSPLRGWPAGANGMFGNAMTHISSTMANSFEVIYWCEPDAIPIRPNWYWDLVMAWRARHPTANIVGCRHDCNGDGSGDHITGCALYHPNIARILPAITTCDNVAWDYKMRAKIVAMGGSTNLIQNMYKQTSVDPRVLDQSSVVVIHGIKGSALVNMVKVKYGIP